MSEKFSHFYFYDNFDKSGPVFIIFHCYIQKRSMQEDLIKTTTSPQICFCTTLQKIDFNY